MERTYKTITKRERSVQLTLRVTLIVFGLCFIAFLGFALSLYKSSYNTNLVVDTKGQFLPYEVVNRKRVMEHHLKMACESTSNFINSFDRATLKSNQAKALFYVDRNSAYRIFTTYKKQGFYDDVLANGYAHVNGGVLVDSLQLETDPFFVRFYSTTDIYDGINKISSIEIKSEANISTITPSNDNMIGWYFTNFKQEYSRK